MRKIFLVFISLFFLCNYSFGQSYYIIQHIGISDRNIPPIIIKLEKEDQGVFDSDSLYNSIRFPIILEFDSNKYHFFKKFIDSNKCFLEKEFRNLEFGTFRVVIKKGNTHMIFYISSLRSIDFFAILNKKAKEKKLSSELELYIKTYIK